MLPLTPLLHTDKLTAYHTSRGCCKPESPYSGFNICHYTGDAPEHIASCRKAFAAEFGIPAERIIIPRQTHSTNVATITTLPVDTSDIDNVDAIVTNRHDIIIGVNTADCVPVVLIDPSSGISGVAHAGWRGAVGGIVQATIYAMKQMGASTADTIAAIGPSICQCCFEVGTEVASAFPKDCVDYTSYAKPHVSLQKYIHNTLLDCGLHINNITPIKDCLCTKCHSDTLWSARRLGINSGRIFTFIAPK